MVTVQRYRKGNESAWNTLIAASANATFILDRRYMDYHKDRFTDHSLLFLQDKKLIAVFPANEKLNRIVSHGGLTYGGLIVLPKTKLFTTLSCIYSLVKYYHTQGFKRIRYKPVPWFFHTTRYYQDFYALFLMGSALTTVNTGFATDLTTIKSIPKDGRYMIRKAKQYNMRVVKARDCRTFWDDVLVPHLAKHFATRPVHSIEEIEMLRIKFPTHICQYNAMINDTIISGATIFLDRRVAHCQYIAGNDDARKTGANDYLMWHLMTKTFKNLRFFSFGTTNMRSPDGRSISRGLVEWKEGFGATMFPYPCYDIETKNHRMLEAYR